MADIENVYKERMNKFIDFWFKEPRSGNISFSGIEREELDNMLKYILTGDDIYVSTDWNGHGN